MYNVQLFHLLSELGWALTSAGLKRARPENFRWKTSRIRPKKQRAGPENFRQKTSRVKPKKQRAGPGQAVIFRPMQGSSICIHRRCLITVQPKSLYELSGV